ncbi:hypothetical protein ACFFF5_10540 [Lederbergia wuyishanensis]|uniref:Uncharacterized protein n=1 Tax=Lederbergia wuyishanensis TaxID=1347903 RepID=A0ABU0D6X9_9BACI|nr:hypothetical protein [Lederbergia wuyishanensis]MCJ8008808.1 hypothetical protein [Lederbergia wuyishanensis]MDQ0344130.1 hypothetical protein [Lederbergia wuyishanensis]
MEIYFSPEVITPHYQILNVVDSKNKAVGNLAILFNDKKLYVYGILEEEGVGADFKDLVTPYIKGLAKSNPETDILCCLYVGCKKIELKEDEEEKK